MVKMIEKRPIDPIHPGSILNNELIELEISPAELAKQIHVPVNRINQLIAGKHAMTADMALRLEQWLGLSAKSWMNRQTQYELEIISENFDEEIKPTIQPYTHQSHRSRHSALILNKI